MAASAICWSSLGIIGFELYTLRRLLLWFGIVK